MVQLPNRDDRGHLCSYLRNFEQWVIQVCRTEEVTLSDKTLDDRYNELIEEWGGRWEPDGFVFENEKDAAMFILRWS